MKKVGFWCAFLGILLIGCGNTVVEQGNLSFPIEDKNSQTTVIQEQSFQATAPTSNSNPIILYPVDKYTGFITTGYAKGMTVNNVIASSVPTPKKVTWTGFITFDISQVKDIGSYDGVELRFFSVKGAPLNAKDISSYVTAYLPHPVEYSEWKNYSCFSSSPSCDPPISDIQIANIYPHTFGWRFGAMPEANGWWHVRLDKRLQLIMANWHSVEPLKYITFVISNGHCSLNNVFTRFPLFIEDGGNHYRTGNRPVLVLRPPSPPSPPPGNNTKVLNSIDLYTGSLYYRDWDYQALSLPGIIDSSRGDVLHPAFFNKGFMTFDLSDLAQGTNIGKAQLDFYGINVSPNVSSCVNPRILMYYLTPDDSQYATWQSFFAPWYNPGTHGFYTSGIDSPEPFTPATGFEAVPDGKGWWQVKDSDAFRNIFQQDIINGVRYITFVPSTILCSVQSDWVSYWDIYLNHTLIIEDGANHGGTGNLPTLTLGY